MSWSLIEIRSLCVKAARGAGMPWGLAEEAGFAVHWLEERSLPGVEALAGYLGKIQEFDTESCPVARGARVSDSGDWESASIARCHQPVLILPFLSNVADDEAIHADWGNGGVTVLANQISKTTDNLLCDGTCSVKLTAGINGSQAKSMVTRVPDDRMVYVRKLETFAHKTYAPSTEESRAKGAGAGLTDND